MLSDPQRKARVLVPVGYLVLALCALMLAASVLSGSIVRTAIAVICLYMTWTALDHNRNTLSAGNRDQGVVDQPGPADEHGQGH